MTLWHSGRSAGQFIFTRPPAARPPVEPAADTCNFEALGLTREAWAGLAADDQRSMVVRFLAALGRGTAEELEREVGALPDAAARLAFLESRSGCRVPEGAAPGGGGGGGSNPFVVSVTGGGGAATDLTPEKADAARDASEVARWILTHGGEGRPRRGGALLALAALALLASGRRRKR